MKYKILIGCLIISLLLNAAGIVFFIGFLHVSGQYKAVKKQRNEIIQKLANNPALAGISSANIIDQTYKRNFVSLVDGQSDSFAVIPPSFNASDFTLVVYLHGMGSSYLEPFMMPKSEPIAYAVTAFDPSIAFLSLSYRNQASWGNDKAMADISQNIREICEQFPIKRIVLMGTSMGGCTVLTYATQAPQDIKDKIVGIVSVESAGDLSKLYFLSKHPAIQPALIAAFGGSPQQVTNLYQHKSFLYNLSELPNKTRVAIISATEDDIVPASLQKEIKSALDEKHIPAKLIEISADHGVPDINIYMEGLKFALGK